MQTQYAMESGCKESVRCEYTAEEVNEAFDKAVKMYASSLQMDGFRKGKVPVSIVEQRIGEELLFKVVEILSRPVYDDVNDRKGILLSSGLSPKVEKEEDMPLPKRNATYVVTYEYNSIPEVVLPSYELPERELVVEPVSDKELDKAILHLLRQTASLEDADRVHAVDGDIASIDLVIKEGEVTIGEQKEYAYVLPCDSFLAPLEMTIRKMKKGEHQEVEIDFPVAKSAEELSIVSGKKCKVSLYLHEIRTIPSIVDNTELLSKMGYDSYEKFREGYKELLLEYKTSSSKSALQRDIIISIASRVECEVPSTLVELFTDAILDNFENIVTSQGFSVNLFASEFKHIMDTAGKLALDMAKNQVVLLNIAKAENIAVSDTEFSAFIQQLAYQSGVEPMKLYEEYKESDMLLVLYQRLLADKTSLHLYNQVVKSGKSKSPSVSDSKSTKKKAVKKDTPELLEETEEKKQGTSKTKKASSSGVKKSSATKSSQEKSSKKTKE